MSIRPFDGLRLFVGSERDPETEYLVDLEPTPEAPAGECMCDDFQFRRLPLIALGSPRVTCKHLRAARKALAI